MKQLPPLGRSLLQTGSMRGCVAESADFTAHTVPLLQRRSPTNAPKLAKQGQPRPSLRRIAEFAAIKHSGSK